jgi:murein DD-endopeptidase MepM/ murein hydrolase activator NlpD
VCLPAAKITARVLNQRLRLGHRSGPGCRLGSRGGPAVGRMPQLMPRAISRSRRSCAAAGLFLRWRRRLRLQDRFRPLVLALLALVVAAQPPAAGAVLKGRSGDGVAGASALPDESVQDAIVEQRVAVGRLRAAPGAEGVVQAAIRGLAMRSTALAEEAGARQVGLARAGGALPIEAEFERLASTPALARIRAAPRDRQASRAWNRSVPVLASLHDADMRASPPVHSMLDAGRMAAPVARVAAARVYRPDAPIMPLPGEIVRAFERTGGLRRPGLVIAAAPGQAVAAPDGGRVVFADAFKSYGLLLIIEHGREYHTLLWGFSRIDVAYGEEVRAGQVVGAMAADATGTPELHVELRRNGRPVNPMPWLAASTSRIRG